MLTTLPSRVSELFADTFQTAFRELDRETSWNPLSVSNGKLAPLSVWNDDKSFHIEMDVPGMTFNDLDVFVENGKLTVRGERKSNVPSDGYFYNERALGQFERVITLNEWVDPETIEANLRNGMLHIMLLKKPAAQRQKIAIQDGSTSDVKRIEKSN